MVLADIAIRSIMGVVLTAPLSIWAGTSWPHTKPRALLLAAAVVAALSAAFDLPATAAGRTLIGVLAGFALGVVSVAAATRADRRATVDAQVPATVTRLRAPGRRHPLDRDVAA